MTRAHAICACLAALAMACGSAMPAASPAHHAARPPEVSTAPAPDRLALRLPVEGVWIVSQGYHGAETHRGRAAYAIDLVKVDDAGRAYAGSGKRTSDWYGFGAQVLASADGVVVRAVDRYPDNRVWGKQRDTNTVIVRHDGDVFSEYVHLQRGSLQVAVGDRVQQGQVIARCGNSGAETPHVHWALLSSIEPIRTQPATFARYDVRDDAGEWHATSGVPENGQLIRNAADSSTK